MTPFAPPEAYDGPRLPNPLLSLARLGAFPVQPRAGSWKARELVKQKTNELPYQKTSLQIWTDQGLTSARFSQLQVLLPEQPVLLAKRPKFGLHFSTSLDHFLFSRKEGSEYTQKLKMKRQAGLTETSSLNAAISASSSGSSTNSNSP